jgi:hypothetical protein
MNKEHKIKISETCDETSLVDTYGSLDGFKEHCAALWSVSVDRLTYELVGPTHTLSLSHCCHDDLIAGNFNTVEGFKQHFAGKWNCTVEDLTYEEIDLTPITIQRAWDAEEAKAKAYIASKFDSDKQRSCQKYIDDIQRWGLYDPALDIVQWIEEASDALLGPEGIWSVYYANKQRIAAGEETVEYAMLDNLMPIATITQRYWELKAEAVATGKVIQ